MVVIAVVALVVVAPVVIVEVVVVIQIGYLDARKCAEPFTWSNYPSQ